jgi:hypothetical protein
MIIDIKPSNYKNKRFEITLNNGKKFNFGYKFGNTFIDHNDKKLRENYLKRHMANKKEKYLNDNLIPSNSLFSAKLLWGDTNDIYMNISLLNELFKKKYGYK